jgi:hypothetical protein
VRYLVLTVIVTLVWMPQATAFDRGAGGWFLTGNKLHDWCEQFSDNAMNYITGVADGAQYSYVNSEGYLGPSFCSPDGAVTGQYRDIVCDYLDDHPETRQGTAAGLIGYALAEAWPCNN